MQIVIDIDDETYNDIKKGKIYSSFRDVPLESVNAIANGTPLDNLRAEIRKHCERYMDGDIIADEVIQAVENIGKAKSDHTCHTCKHYTSGEYDGSCDSYVCEHYSNWEREDKE